MSLNKHLALTYALFVCISILILSAVINRFALTLFSRFVTDNIRTQSEKIAESVAGEYDPVFGVFDVPSVEALGMYFVHQGYILSVADASGGMVWDARGCDMKECDMVIGEIQTRMSAYRTNGAFQSAVYPLRSMDNDIGKLTVETFGPFFYSERESEFLSTLNRFLLKAGVVFTLLSVLISVLLARKLAKPILTAAFAARRITEGKFELRIPDSSGVRELRELCMSVNELASALENGEKWQKRLTGDISHELRTPLTTLQSSLEAMIDGVWEPTPARLSSCHEEVVRLNSLVEDLNQLSILEREQLSLHKTEFDLAKMLESVVEQFLPAAREKGIALSVSPCADAVPVYADYDRLRQVFINLVSNALKYTDSGSITVCVEKYAPENAPHFQIVTVTDTGIGIPESDLPHIFERFYRTDTSRSRNTGGAGIGLSIASVIIAAHDGKISVESALNRGSTFRVEI